ncbi:hypothetical protein [Methylobacter sp. sgz302048]|uniref:hypothetical protein n=1 Tax=Methylobacter sp. sgz302048 TaxID=3455945 RepID=UPI003F9F3994
MAIEIVHTCPLGHTCEEVKDNKIHRCAWYTALGGTNPQTGELIKEEWNCSLAWMPIMLVETAKTNLGQTAAIESFRNETVNQAAQTNEILATAVNFAINKDKPVKELPTYDNRII